MKNSPFIALIVLVLITSCSSPIVTSLSSPTIAALPTATEIPTSTRLPTSTQTATTVSTQTATTTSTLTPVVGCFPGHEIGLSTTLQPGITHVGGNYRFTDENFLIEGSRKVAELGSKVLFIWLSLPNFRIQYSDNKANLWPVRNPNSITALIQTTPYKQAISLPFSTIGLTIYSSNPEPPYRNDWYANGQIKFKGIEPSRLPGILNNIEREYYDLTKYLLTNYRGCGKIFILKNWEGDNHWLQHNDIPYDYQTRLSIPEDDVQDMISWLSARQRGVSKARAEMGNVPGVQVFNAVEVNLVLALRYGDVKRVLNAVVPFVRPDMVSYSSWETNAFYYGNKEQAKQWTLDALALIDRWSPDPLNLGRRRIIIGENGINNPGSRRPDDTSIWRVEGVLEAAAEYGIPYTVFWEIFDNDCPDLLDPSGRTMKALGNVARAIGDPGRPTNSMCPGNWLIRPDGTEAPALSVLRRYW